MKTVKTYDKGKLKGWSIKQSVRGTYGVYYKNKLEMDCFYTLYAAERWIKGSLIHINAII